MTDHPQPFRHDLRLPTIRFAAWRWSPPAGAPSLGRQLVILHGVTAGALGFAEVARDLAEDGWTVDALDLPGHGATRWLGADAEPLANQESVGPGAYELGRVGALVAAAIRALPPAVPATVRPAEAPPGTSAGAPVVLGHSWGAGVAVMAIDADAPVDRLVLLDPPFVTPEQGEEMAEGFRAQLADGLRWERAEVAQARAVVAAADPGLPDDELEARVRELTARSPGAADAIARGVPMDPIGMMVSWRSRHPDLPVDVIAGDPDAGGLVPTHIQALLRMALGPDRVHVLEGLGHSPQHEDVRRLLDVLRAVLRSETPQPT